MSDERPEGERVAILETHWHELNRKLDDILEQTRRTNGRVSALENWRNWLTGAVVTMGLLWTVGAWAVAQGFIHIGGTP